MGKLLLVRHAEKGNGSDTGKKFHLSPAGQLAALELGRNLPEDFVKDLKYVGGSEMSRSLHTALLIAIGAGVDPQILESNKYLGSENQLFKEFKVTIESYMATMKKCDNIETKALKTVISKSQFRMLASQLHDAISTMQYSNDNAILGTHSPWLQIAVEMITGKEFNTNTKELDWILIETKETAPWHTIMRIVASSLDVPVMAWTLPLSLGGKEVIL